tara:strand:- start:1556 stop:2380 length:825 start_codon:yes stop_codon:yes gene_type:complete
MLHRSLAAVAVSISVLAASPSFADDTDVLFDALGLPEILEVMRAEGIEYGAQIGTDLFPRASNASWAATVETIYDASTMLDRVKSAFKTSLEGDDVPVMLEYFTTEPGLSFARLEVSARRALLDDAVEEASKELAVLAGQDQTIRYKQVERFVQINDLVETNVVGALNSNYAFYTGLMAGGAFSDALTEDQILSDVWDQEPDIRANTNEWVYSFLLLAYDPVSDVDMENYIAFSQTTAGAQLNTTLFDAFDAIFDDISFTLGREAARMMSGAEL